MAIFSSKLLRHEFCMEELRNIGAEVVNVEGVMFYVKYKLDELNIEYLYHLYPDNTYLLERIKPYSLNIGEFLKEEDVVEIIKIDIDQFKNAKKSTNFNDFVSIDKTLAKIVRYFEDLYLYYNIDKEDIDLLEAETYHLKDVIMQIKERSKRVYHKKEPDSFNE